MTIVSGTLLVFLSENAVVSGQESSVSRAGVQAGERAVINLDGYELAFRWCPPGSFVMGSPENEAARMPDPWERPHPVTLTSGFWLLETEVTQKLYQMIQGNNPSFWRGDERPVEMIGMPQCANFCAEFAKKTGLKAKLPTEAEWEYACRAGTQTAFSSGGEMTWREMQCRKPGPLPENQTRGTVPVRSFAPNAWGLYDMHGNVAEWVNDPFDPEYYRAGPANDPPGPTAGANRVLRGGGWPSLPEFCRSAARNLDVEPYSCASSYGFRFLIVP